MTAKKKPDPSPEERRDAALKVIEEAVLELDREGLYALTRIANNAIQDA